MVESVLPQLYAAFWSLASFLVAIVVLVTFHEWGHFWMARRVGVRVLRFSIGFGKPLLTWHDREGTEYVVAGIPFGGYVKMLDEREDDVTPSDLPFSFSQQPVWKRILIVLAGPVANLLLAVLLFWGLFIGGESGIAPTIGKVVSGSKAAIAGVMSGDEIIRVDGLETPTRDAVFSALVARIGDSGVMVLDLRQREGGQLRTASLTLDRWLSDAADPDPLEGLGIEFFHPPHVRVLDVKPGGTAEQAGLLVGDVVETVDGQAVDGPRAWVEVIRASAGKPLVFGVRRGTGWIELVVTPAEVRAEDGQMIGQIGAQPGYLEFPPESLRHIDYSFLSAMGRAGEEFWRQTRLLITSLCRLVVGDLSPKNLSGPLGIAKVAGASAGMGLGVFCQTLAVLSISLGVMNLLPIPMLDGGHLVLYLVEGFRGRPVPEQIQMLGNQIGLVLLASLMLFAVYNDILKF